MLRIDEILKEKGISNQDFAVMMKVSETSASAYKSGRTKPKFDALVRMSEVLEVDIRELFKSSKTGNDLIGFIEYKGKIHKINSKKDLEQLLKTVE